jgi:hypothetical protein
VDTYDRRAIVTGPTFRGHLPPQGTYYHGTSTALGIQDRILPPTETGKQTESRVQRRGKVFLTVDFEYAQSYANRAVREWGGQPVVFEVTPMGPVKQISGTPGKTAFYTEGAQVNRVHHG